MAGSLRIIAALPLVETVVVVIVVDVVVGTTNGIIVGVVARVIIRGMLVTIGRWFLGPRARAVATGVLDPGSMCPPKELGAHGSGVWGCEGGGTRAHDEGP